MRGREGSKTKTQTRFFNFAAETSLKSNDSARKPTFQTLTVDMSTDDLPFRAEYAKSGRAGCKKCKEKIDKGIGQQSCL